MQILLHFELTLQFGEVVILILVNRRHSLICLEVGDGLLLEVNRNMVLQKLDVFVFALVLLLCLVQQRQ